FAKGTGVRPCATALVAPKASHPARTAPITASRRILPPFPGIGWPSTIARDAKLRPQLGDAELATLLFHFCNVTATRSSFVHVARFADATRKAGSSGSGGPVRPSASSGHECHDQIDRERESPPYGGYREQRRVVAGVRVEVRKPVANLRPAPVRTRRS